MILVREITPILFELFPRQSIACELPAENDRILDKNYPIVMRQVSYLNGQFAVLIKMGNNLLFTTIPVPFHNFFTTFWDTEENQER